MQTLWCLFFFFCCSRFLSQTRQFLLAYVDALLLNLNIHPQVRCKKLITYNRCLLSTAQRVFTNLLEFMSMADVNVKDTSRPFFLEKFGRFRYVVTLKSPWFPVQTNLFLSPNLVVFFLISKPVIFLISFLPVILSIHSRVDHRFILFRPNKRRHSRNPFYRFHIWALCLSDVNNRCGGSGDNTCLGGLLNNASPSFWQCNIVVHLLVIFPLVFQPL